MARLSDLNRQALGVSGPREAAQMVGAETMAPIREFSDNMKPSAIFSNALNDLGFVSLFATIKESLKNLVTSGKENQNLGKKNQNLGKQNQDLGKGSLEELKRIQDNTENHIEKADSMTDILSDIREVLFRTYQAMSGEDSQDIAQRRREERLARAEKVTPTDDKDLPDLSKLRQGLSYLRDISAVAIGTGLAQLAGVFRFLGQAVMIGGPLALVSGAILALEQQDWENLVQGLSENFQKIADGEWLTGLSGLVTTIGSTIYAGAENLVDRLNVYLKDEFDVMIGEDPKKWIGTTATGAALGMLTPKLGAIRGAIAGLAIGMGDSLGDWLHKQNLLTEPVAKWTGDTLGLMGAGASIGMMFGPKGALLGAVAGFTISAGNQAWKWLRDVDWDQVYTDFKEMIPDWVSDLATFLYDNTIKPWVSFFDNLIDGDLKGAIEELLPLFLFPGKFAEWIYNRTLGAFGDFLLEKIKNPKETLTTMFGNDSLWSNLWGWVWDNTLGKVATWMNDVITDPKTELTKLFNESPMFRFHQWIWNNTLGKAVEAITSLFESDESITTQLKNFIEDKAPWLFNITDWVWDTIISPIVSVMDTITEGVKNIREKIINLIPDWAKEWILPKDVYEDFKNRNQDPATVEHNIIRNMENTLAEKKAELDSGGFARGISPMDPDRQSKMQEARDALNSEIEVLSDELANRNPDIIHHTPAPLLRALHSNFNVDTSKLKDNTVRSLGEGQVSREELEWRPPASAIRNNADNITPMSNRDNRNQGDASTIVGSINIDHSNNISSGGGISYAPLSTRPKESSLHNLIVGY